MFVFCLYCYSSAEASTKESNASITFYEADEEDVVIDTGDENIFIDGDGSNQNQGTVPKTGATSMLKLVLLGSGALFFLLILFMIRRKRESRERATIILVTKKKGETHYEVL